MKRASATLSLILLLTVSTWSAAQDITSFADGRLAFESVSNGLYRVEWKPSLLDTNNWSSDSPFGMIVATGTSTIASVPVFYRVKWLNPPPYGIQGEVRHGLTPISNVQVRLFSGEGIPISNTVSGSDGTYFFSDLTNGHYCVRVDAFRDYLAASNSVTVENDDATSFVWLPEKLLPVFPTNNHVLGTLSPLYQWESIPSVYSWSIGVQQLTTTSPPPYSLQTWVQIGVNTNEWQQPEPLPAGCRFNWEVKAIYAVPEHGFVPFAEFEAPIEFETEE